MFMKKIVPFLVAVSALFAVICICAMSDGADKTKPYAAPDVTFKMADKTETKLSTLKGNVVLILAGTVGSKPDSELCAAVAAVLEGRKDKAVKAFHVNYYQGAKHTEDFLKNNPLSFPAVADQTGAVSEKLGVACNPTLFVIDKFGMVRLIGSSDKDALGALVDSLLAEEKTGSSFTSNASPSYEKGKPLPPLAVKLLKGKGINIYSVFPSYKYTFILITKVG
jgi:peroxiredoxin